MSSDVLESTKALCRSVLMCNSYGVVASKFAREFEDTTGNILPLKKLGVRNVLDLSKLMPDVMKQERNAQGMIVFYVVADEKTAHIAKMKSREKSKSGKKNRRLGPRKIFFENSSGTISRTYGPALSRSTPSYNNRSSMSRAAPAPRQAPTSRFAPSSNSSSHEKTRAAMYGTSRTAASTYSHTPSQSVSSRLNTNQTSRISGHMAREPVKQPEPVPQRYTKPIINQLRVPAGLLCSKIRQLMREFISGLWSGNLVMEYEKYFNEPAADNLLELVLQMEGNVVRIERPHGHNSSKFILYSIEEPEEPEPVPQKPASASPVRNGMVAKSKYPYTYRYIHAPLPWLGVSMPCFVTLAHSPDYFWIQVKSEHLDDLCTIAEMIQINCQKAPPEVHGRFFVDELVCGLYTDGQWYRSIVIDVGLSHNSCRDKLDPALFLPNKATPQFSWKSEWKVKVFFVDYGNIEWLPLSNIRREKYPYPPGQAFRCSLAAISPTGEWDQNICDTFRRATEDSETLAMTVEAVKSDKAHYGFKSRLQEYCQRNRREMPVYDRPLNSDSGWRTTVSVVSANGKNVKQYKGFYQLKKNDSEASAAQHVIRDMDIQLLHSRDIPGHWLEIHLEEKTTGEHFNKSLVEVQAATPKTSIYDMVIPKQPPAHEVPQFKSDMIVTYTAETADSTSEEDESLSAESTTTDVSRPEPEPLELPEIGSIVHMTVTHVQSPKNFCMRILEEPHPTKLHEMEDEITDELKVYKSHVDEVKLNMLVVVLQSKIAYRGKVLRVLRNNRAEVLMLDYGDTIEFKFSELYHFHSENYSDVPYQAISCCLYGMENIIDVPVISEYMVENFEDVKVMAKIKDIVNGNTLSVELYSEEQINLNQEILARDIRTLKPNLPDDSELHLVLLTNISDDGVLSLQIPGPGVRSLGQLMAELTQHYEDKGPLKASDYIPNPRKGQMCCAAFKSQDGTTSWYRALVDRKINDDNVEVKYVDYGNISEIPTSKLREPTKAVPNISRLPFQALSVQLADLPTDGDCWTSKEIDTLRGYVKDQAILAQVVQKEGHDYPLVRIYIESQTDKSMEINQLMSGDSNLFTRMNGHVDDLGTDLDQLSIRDTLPVKLAPEAIVLYHSMLPKLKIQYETEAMISHVDSPSSWYFQSCKYHKGLRDLGEQMQEFYSKPLQYDHSTFELGQMCVAYCTKYHGWYRAKVKSLTPDKKQAECSMVDYGDINMIPLSNLRPLVMEFATLPIQACGAKLAGVSPKDGSGVWDAAAKSYFSRAVSERMLWVRFVAMDTVITNLLQMDIIDTSREEDISIAADMRAKGHAVDPLPPSSPSTLSPMSSGPSSQPPRSL